MGKPKVGPSIICYAKRRSAAGRGRARQGKVEVCIDFSNCVEAVAIVEQIVVFGGKWSAGNDFVLTLLVY